MRSVASEHKHVAYRASTDKNRHKERKVQHNQVSSNMFVQHRAFHRVQFISLDKTGMSQRQLQTVSLLFE